MKYSIWGVVIAVLAGGIIWAVADKDTEPESAMMEEKDEMMQKDDSKMQEDDKMMQDDSSMMSKEGVYADYSVERVAAEQKAGRKVVLYFYAPWCPFCRAADADFRANPNKISPDVAVLKLDYDKETALKSKYGVTYQHTFVQIDDNGNEVTKWVSGDTDLLIKNIK